MRVLIIVDHFWPSVGGVERLFASLGAALVQQGMGVDVLTLRQSGMRSREQYRGMQITRLRAANRLFFAVFACWKAFWMAKDCDVIHTSTYASAIPARLAGWLRRKPVMLTLHEVLGKRWFALPDLPRWKAIGYWFVEQLVCRLPYDRVVCVSEATRKDAEQLFPSLSGRLETIHNGIDYQRWTRQQRSLRDEQQPQRFLYYGRNGVTKGLSVLLEAWNMVIGERPELRLELMIPGRGQVWKSLEQRLVQMGLEYRVRLRPSVPEQSLPAVLSEADCVVVPSLTEGFGFAVVENVALGTPLVVSAAGSIPEVISGRFVMAQPGDAEALADALLKAARGEFQERAERRFPLQATVDSYSSLYADLSPR